MITQIVSVLVLFPAH